MPETTLGASAPASQVYTWEPSNAVIAARYGLRAEDILRFDLNTSPGAPAWLADALAGPFEPPLNEYPDSLYAELTRAIAAYVGAEPEEVVVGAGADEVLDIVAKAHLPMGGRAIVPIPTYSMYGVLTSQRRADIVAIPRLGVDDGFALDRAALLPALADARLVWLCAPNNPTGAPERHEVVEEILAAAAALGPGGPSVVVDEAYVEFQPPSLVPLRTRYPNLIVVRTIAKAFGLAGVRVGWAVAKRPVIERLERFRPPGSVSTLSAHVATRALRDPDGARRNAATLSAEREWLAGRLRDRGLPPYPSVTNFVLCRIGDAAAAEDLTEHLLRNGIVVRTFGPANPLRGHLRFTVRTREQNERFLSVLAGWLEGGRA